jgi:6-phosphogluconolactonase
VSQLDRRRFLQIAGSASLLSAADARLGWAQPQRQAGQFAYIGTATAIHAFGIADRGSFPQLQTVSTARPGAMAIFGHRLYVANDVSQFEHLPRGTVEAYAIDPVSGHLTFLNRVPLSLSGSHPRDLAISPDGRSLVVAIHGGGAYNLLSLEADGRLGRVIGIRKEIGAGPHALQTAAHPSAIAIDRGGRVFTADFGSDRLTVLSLDKGELTAIHRSELPAGSGPAAIALHGDGRSLFVAHALKGELSSFECEPSGTMNLRQTVRSSGGTAQASLALHPRGTALYISHGDELQGWQIRADGMLRLSSKTGFKTHALRITPDGTSLLALTQDAVFRIRTDDAVLLPAERVASLVTPISIAVL